MWGVLVGSIVYGVVGEVFTRWQRGQRLGLLPDLPLLAPATPSKIVRVGRNYAAHAEEHCAEVPQEPRLFLKPPSAVIGPGDAIVRPSQSQRVEYEAESCIVMKSRCRNVTLGAAWGYVLGATCGNDVTARDLQRQDGQWTRAKGFDTFCPRGPHLVAGLSEAEMPTAAIQCRANGELCQSGLLRDMVFTPSELIAYISTVMTLLPGDVVMTGTPSGVGRCLPAT